MKRLLTSAAVAGSLVLLAACGSDDSDDSSSPATIPGGSTPTVSVAEVDGIGSVLVDVDGMALYTADEEADGVVLCTDSCTSFWEPLEAGDATPTAGPGVAGLGVIERPDGTRQVTQDGRLLYTFSQDSPGDVTGDGFSDDFGGQHLTWHAVHSDAASAPPPEGTTGSSNSDGPYGDLPGYGT
ncbi:MAG: COG4315 family predicted lipoprotein [Ilumatobacteraceae bacterium]